MNLKKWILKQLGYSKRLQNQENILLESILDNLNPPEQKNEEDENLLHDEEVKLSLQSKLQKVLQFSLVIH
jgi:hypothetical protein